MKVLLVSNYVVDKQHSMLGFASCLERELPALGCQVTRTAPRPIFGVHGRKASVRKWLAYVDKYVLFPAVLRRLSARHDVTHILDQGNSIYVQHVVRRPHLVTCHDVLAIRAALGEIPGWEVSPTGRKYQAMILHGLNRSRMIAVDSMATGADLSRLTGRAPDRTRLIYIGQVQDMPRVSDAQADRFLSESGLRHPYLLHVGNSSPYKNRKGLVAIYEKLLELVGEDCPELVLAGADPMEELQTALCALPAHKVHSIVGPSFELLSALYQRAAGLVFPSLYEGFGLPIVEAQSLGCPVFTSDRAPMTEIGGRAARYFDPLDPIAAARAIADGLKDASSMRTQGLENVERFSPRRMAKEYLELYEQLVAG